ncbi:HD domain-containing protein [Desulfosporosinus sp. SB140]|uniref:HD domain-containing protein n=1 Tax=Desulfosporosinus paludis TaxID=3115649 RepID=UPI0038909F9F
MNWEFIKRLQDVYEILDKIELQTMERDYPIIWEKVHATSCAQIGRMLAQKRQVDVEQAALACALHDSGRWVTGRQENHAPKGEELTRRFLEKQSFPRDIQELIVKAVIHHSKKEEIGTPLEELVKDADILDCYWYGDSITKKFHVARVQKVLYDLKIVSSMEG